MGRMNFGYILRQLRKEREETLEQVSAATGLSVAMLSRIERGERLPSPESVEALATHFDLPVDYLMSETIANRMVNRYGEESTSRAAERLSREPLDLALFYADSDSEEAPAAGATEGTPRGVSPRQPRRYAVFREMDIREALGSPDPRRREPHGQDEVRSAVPPLAAPQEVLSPAPAAASPGGAALPASTTPGSTGSEIDPATERVLRAAQEASEAAAVLILREAPYLSREARLELTERVSRLAGQASDVLKILASDPDGRVRAAARQALKRLSR